MQCKPLVSSLAVVMALVCVLLGNVSASAHTVAPASFNCTSQCSSWGYWNGTTYGGISSFTVSDPGFHTSPATWDRYIRLGSGNPHVIIGLFKSVGGGYGNYCSGAGAGLKYGFYMYDDQGFNYFNSCQSVNSADINHQVIVKALSLNADCASGQSEFIFNWFSSAGFKECVTREFDNGAYNRMQLQEGVTDNVSGHQVWGSKWITNQYISYTGGFVEQTRGEDFLSARNPPQMYWANEPSTSYPGGQQYSCVYDSGTTCTFGS